jgi:hypothetical protein
VRVCVYVYVCVCADSRAYLDELVEKRHFAVVIFRPQYQGMQSMWTSDEFCSPYLLANHGKVLIDETVSMSHDQEVQVHLIFIGNMSWDVGKSKCENDQLVLIIYRPDSTNMLQ